MTAQVPDPSTLASRAQQRKLAAAEEEVARLRRDLAEARAELAESREAEAEGLARETATSDILRVISRSQTDLQPVFDEIMLSAVHLLRADVSVLTRVVGDQLRIEKRL